MDPSEFRVILDDRPLHETAVAAWCDAADIDVVWWCTTAQSAEAETLDALPAPVLLMSPSARRATTVDLDRQNLANHRQQRVAPRADAGDMPWGAMRGDDGGEAAGETLGAALHPGIGLFGHHLA
jgi:hypothetical protein